MPDTTNKETSAHQVMEAVTALRTEFDKKTIDLDKIDKIEKFLDAQEAKNQAYVKQKKEAEKAEIELKERLAGIEGQKKEAEKSAVELKGRMDELEVELARASASGEPGDYKKTDEYKAMLTYCKVGERIDNEQKQLLRTDSDTAGGFLTTVELDSVITKKITEISNIRSVARVRTISSKSLEVPVRDTILAATYEGEAESNEDSASSYSNETLNSFRQTVNIPITMDMLMDSEFNMESEIMGDAGEAFAQGEGLNFVVGDGVKKPSGFVSDIRIQANARETAAGGGTLTADDIILLTGDLKVGYNPVYIFNRQTLAFIRTLRATDGNILWMPGLNGPIANTINGFDYLIAQDMPDIANDAYPVAFGDFQRGYTIVDRTGMSVIRDEFTRKKNSIVEFTINRWNYGQVTLPEAITLLNTQA